MSSKRRLRSLSTALEGPGSERKALQGWGAEIVAGKAPDLEPVCKIGVPWALRTRKSPEET